MTLQKCIICDLDGTLCDISHRGPYDGTKCENDGLVQPVYNMLQMYMANQIILLSGREDKFRPQTENWLKKYSVPYNYLFMRKSGDRRRDSIIKMELFNEHINGKFEPLFCLDDRFQVIKEVWNKLGIFCFICNQELKEF